MTLDQTPKGKEVYIQSIRDQKARLQALRFGIAEGAKVECFEVIPHGPVMVATRGQEIAIGRRLARQIEVRPSVELR
jgi:Fe2+ transport system protein FeoA